MIWNKPNIKSTKKPATQKEPRVLPIIASMQGGPARNGYLSASYPGSSRYPSYQRRLGSECDSVRGIYFMVESHKCTSNIHSVYYVVLCLLPNS